MPYELFHNKAAKFGSPQLTIRDRKIAISADASDILARRGMKFAHILWDAEACKLAIKPIAKQDEKAFKMSTLRGRRGRTLSAGSFLNYIKWSAGDAPIVVAAHWNEADGLLEAVLPKKYVGSIDTGEVRRKAKTTP